MHQPNPVTPAPDVVQKHTRRDAKHALPTISCVIAATKLAIMLEFVKPDSHNKRIHKLQSKRWYHQNVYD